MSEADHTKALAAALGRIPSGLFILTARQGANETGMLSSWVQQCSFRPPRVSVGIKGKRDINAWLTPGSVFILNILEEDQPYLVSHFGKGFALTEPAFTGLEIRRCDTDPPILEDALAYLRCTMVSRHAVGDHDLLIGEVSDGQMLNPGEPWIHIRKNGLNY